MIIINRLNMIRVYKCSLKSIVKDAETIDKINNVVYKCNVIVILTYQFIKSYIFDKYRNKQQIPIINCCNKLIILF